MEDRFRFRCWNKKTKKLYEVVHLCNVNDGFYGIMPQVNAYDPIYDKIYHLNVQPKNAILMQCTGLKDKNGKLIYEGDIIKNSCGMCSTINQAVIYDRKEYKLAMPNKRCRKCSATSAECNCCFSEKIKKNPLTKFWWFHPHSCFKEFEEGEIIGNIYENPELLEVQA